MKRNRNRVVCLLVAATLTGCSNGSAPAPPSAIDANAQNELSQLHEQLNSLEARLAKAQGNEPVYVSEPDPATAALLFAMRRDSLGLSLTTRDRAAVDFAYLRLDGRDAITREALRKIARECYEHADTFLQKQPSNNPSD